jgi:hypothetical protein
MSCRTDQDIEVQTAVVFTHTEKILFPEAGITTREVLSFYERISERPLPHLRKRPGTLKHLPEGLIGTSALHFWQKHTPSYYPAWIPRVELPSKQGRPVRYVLVNDQDTLLVSSESGHTDLSRLVLTHPPPRPPRLRPFRLGSRRRHLQGCNGRRQALTRAPAGRGSRLLREDIRQDGFACPGSMGIQWRLCRGARLGETTSPGRGG